MDTPPNTAPPIIATEKKSPHIGEICDRSPWDIKGCTKYPEPIKPGGNSWMSIREPKRGDNPCPSGIRPGARITTFTREEYPRLEERTRCTWARCYNPDCTWKHLYSRFGTKDIPDIRTKAENKRSEVEKGKNTLFSNYRPPTSILDQELEDTGPYQICLGDECKRNYLRVGREHPQLGKPSKEEACPEPNYEQRPDILQPYVLEDAANGSFRMRGFGDSTDIRKITLH